MAVLFVFADNAEFGGIRKYKKTAIPAKAGISLRESANGFALRRMRFPRSREWHVEERGNPSTQKFHSCEGRNLYRRKAAGNCTLLQFAPSARRFLPSQEWN
ncbi:MAG: hypothetical protein ACR2QC_11135 [Gammaproteobacteria bacterium]